MFTGIGFIAFCCIFGAGVAGLLLGKILPEDHRSEATQKSVQLTMNAIGILAALVLSLLVASAKTSLDSGNREVEQFSNDLVLLDREARHFGQEASPIREQLRSYTEEKIGQTWTAHPDPDHSRTVTMLEDIQERLRALVPQNEVYREARSAALRLVDDLKQNSRMLAGTQGGHAPRPFLIVVVFWLSMLFLSYGLFAPRNMTVIAVFVVAAISISMAMNLIADMDHPFVGYIKVSEAPMRQALERMAQ